MTDSKDKILEMLEEMLKTKGTQFTKKFFEGLVINYTYDGDDVLQEVALSVLSTLREIDEEKS
jgi:hypothetical protein